MRSIGENIHKQLPGVGEEGREDGASVSDDANILKLMVVMVADI